MEKPDDPAGDDATVGKKKQKKMDVDVGVPIIDWSIKNSAFHRFFSRTSPNSSLSGTLGELNLKI